MFFENFTNLRYKFAKICHFYVTDLEIFFVLTIVQILKHRKAHVFGHCFSSKKTPEVVEFDAAGLFGGIINDGKRPGDPDHDLR